MFGVDSLISKFCGLFYGQAKNEVEGFIITTDNTANKSLLLVKESQNSWKTKWFNNDEFTLKTPSVSLNSIFNSSS